jgi:uncharacterized protein with von Willebrand factor type A (vWA) domain
MTDAFTANLVHFVRYLRATGLGVKPQTATELAAAARAVGLANRTDVYHAFKAVTVVRPTEVPRFDDAFELFFGASRPKIIFSDESEGAIASQEERSASLPLLAPSAADIADDELEEVSDIVGGSYAERLATKDFADLTATEKEEILRMIARMRWRPADAASRRWLPATRGPRPHLRRTFRGLAGPEGDLMPLAYADRRPRKRPLVVLADISGSMDRYSEMFLNFIHAAQGRLGRVEAFVFSTRLTRITRELRQRDAAQAMRRVGDSVEDWAGGTRIGEAVQAFNWQWSRRVTRGGAIGLIISDGWDTGDPALLESEMRRLARSMHRVIWLNPLAGRPGYAPETRGMQAALPYVDDLLAAGSLRDLTDVIRLLESVGDPRRAVR